MKVRTAFDKHGLFFPQPKVETSEGKHADTVVLGCGGQAHLAHGLGYYTGTQEPMREVPFALPAFTGRE